MNINMTIDSDSQCHSDSRSQ